MERRDVESKIARLESRSVHTVDSEGLRQDIQDWILRLGGATRQQLVDRTGIPRTTIYEILKKMIVEGSIKKEAVHSHKKGRPKVLFKLVIDSKQQKRNI